MAVRDFISLINYSCKSNPATLPEFTGTTRTIVSPGRRLQFCPRVFAS
jgi:hypothetical protein